MNVMRILRHPRAAVVVHDLVMVTLAWLAAGWIINRNGFGGVINDLALSSELVLVLAVQGLILWSTGLYKGLWRFASFPDLWNIARAAAFGTLLIITALTIFYGAQVRQVLGSVLVYPAILFLALGLPRMCYRFWKDSHLPDASKTAGQQRVLVLGAGRSGAPDTGDLQIVVTRCRPIWPSSPCRRPPTSRCGGWSKSVRRATLNFAPCRR